MTPQVTPAAVLFACWIASAGYLQSAEPVGEDLIADPNVDLCYNEFGLENGGQKLDAVVSMLRDFRDRDVPIDSVGLQSHLTIDPPAATERGRYRAPLAPVPTSDGFRRVMDRLADAGAKRIHITELDIATREPISDQDLSRQADAIRQLLETFLSHPAVGSLTCGGVADHRSWIRSFAPGYAAPLLLDRNYQPKPAFECLIQLLRESVSE